MKIRTTLTIDVEDLTDSIEDHDEAASLIKAIDLAMADYTFTERMAKYFVKELIKECSYTGEEFNIKEILK